MKWNESVYRIGDKVLHLVNTPELNVFNGDMGEIVGIILAKDSEDKVDELVIQFDNNEVSYKRNEWNKITLSYCCSIHKAQGSEFKMVILPMVHQYHRMLQRNLLYTAVTRSKEILILLGEVQAFSTCVTHESASRLTMLKERITSADDMTLTVRMQLEAYEEGLSEESPFSDTHENKSVAYEEVKEKKASVVEEKIEPIPTKPKVEELSLFTQPEEEIEEQVALEIKRLLTPALVQEQSIDPMIGMKNITPYDFMK